MGPSTGKSETRFHASSQSLRLRIDLPECLSLFIPYWLSLETVTAAAALLVLFQPRLPSGPPLVELGIGLVVVGMLYVGWWMALPGRMKAAGDVLRLFGKLRPPSHAGRTVPRGAR